MAKAIGTIADVNVFDADNGKFRLTIACSIKPVTGETFPAFKKELYVLLDGTENPQQINTAINTAIKAAATAQGVTLLDTDISNPKFS